MDYQPIITVIMKTVTIQIKDAKALKLLEDLEGLNLIQIVNHTSDSSQKLSERFAGSLRLSDEQHQSFQRHLDEIRNEWERDI